MRSVRICAVVLSTLFSSLASAGVIFSDDFTDGDRNGFFLARGTSGVALSVVDDTGGIGSGNALDHAQSGTGTTSNRPIVAYFPSQTLNDGDKLIYSLDMRLVGTVPTSDRRWRLGLYNSAGTKVTADTGDTSFTNDDTGYTTRNDVGPEASNSTRMDIQTTIPTGGPPPTGPGVLAVTAAVAQSSSTDAAIVDNFAHHMAFTLERSGSSLTTTLTYMKDATTTVTLTGTDAAPATFAFDELAFGQNGVALNYRIDNVAVEFVPGVPEPLGLPLFGLATLVLRRRSRSIA